MLCLESCYGIFYLLCQRAAVGDSLCCVRELHLETLFAMSGSLLCSR